MIYKAIGKKHIREDGVEVTRIETLMIPEEGDEERDMEMVREHSVFLENNGHSNNKWTRLLEKMEKK
jgi:hypothetical protein